MARMRFALSVDDDLSAFYERYRDDPLIGASLRRRPWLRIARRPVAFEALAWAICEQLIESSAALAIERRIVRAFGPRCPRTGLRDVPSAAVLAGCAPARIESFGLAGRRAIALVRVAKEVAAGRIDLERPQHDVAWRGLLAIPTIGRWTVELLAAGGRAATTCSRRATSATSSCSVVALGRRSRRARRGGRGAGAVGALRRVAWVGGRARAALAGAADAGAGGGRLTSPSRADDEVARRVRSAA